MGVSDNPRRCEQSLRQIRKVGLEPRLACLAVEYDRSQWLINFVCDRSRKFGRSSRFSCPRGFHPCVPVRLLKGSAVFNIQVGSVPAEYLSLRVAKWIRANVEQTILPIRCSQAMLIVEGPL